MSDIMVARVAWLIDIISRTPLSSITKVLWRSCGILKGPVACGCSLF